MKQAQPYEFRLAGTVKGREPWRVSVGQGVPDAAAQRLKELFLMPRFSIRHSMTPLTPEDPALVEELTARGYAPQSVRLSIFMQGHGHPRKPRTLRIPSPGGLVLRWGWLDYDHTPDLAGAWAAPAARADLNLLFHVFDNILGSRPTWQPMAAWNGKTGAVNELKQLGWDMRTLDFRAKRNPPSPSLDKPQTAQ